MIGFQKAAALVLVLLSAACAPKSRLDAALDNLTDVSAARQFFGEPDFQAPMADGRIRYDWQRSGQTFVPGQYVEREIFVGYDEDGYPVIWRQNVFVPAHNQELSCRLSLIADQAGRVLQKSREGNDCDALLRGQPAQPR